MLQLDSISNLALGIEDLCAMDASRLSDPDMFRKFAKGIRLEQDFLLNDRWFQAPQMTSPTAPYDYVMHEMLPTVYDARWLERLGGHLGIRITGVGDYTLAVLNRRIVTFSGLPADLESGDEVVDVEVAPDAFMAFCRGLLLDVAEDVLDADDEFEDREISGAELLLHGMPVGGLATHESQVAYDFGHSVDAAASGQVGTIGPLGIAGGDFYGGNSPDHDWYEFHLLAGVAYRFSALGQEQGGGTSHVPHLGGIFDANGTQVHAYATKTSGYDVGPYERMATIDFNPSSSGTYYVSVTDGANAFGSYTLAAFSPVVEMGGDFGGDEDAVSAGTIGTVDALGVGRGTVNEDLDRDWFAVNLEDGVEYIITLAGSDWNTNPLDGEPYIYGIHWESWGGHISQVAWGGGEGQNGHLVYVPSMSGTYYISVGAFGPGTGGYELSIRDASHLATRESDDFGSSLAETQAGYVGTVDGFGVGIGSVDMVGDRDWFALHLIDGLSYRIDLMGSPSVYARPDENGLAMLDDPRLFGLYDSDGAKVHDGDDDSGHNLESSFEFTASASGIYYVEVGAYRDGTGTYTLSVQTTEESLEGPAGSSSSICGAAVSVNSSTMSIDSDWGTVASACGAAVSRGAFSCGMAAALCGLNASSNYQVLAGVGAYSCGTAATRTVIGACGADQYFCGANISETGIYACGGNVGGCGYNVASTLIVGCAANASVCGVAYSYTGVYGCGINVSACGGRASLSLVGGCGANVSGCGARVTFEAGSGQCGANANICGANAPLYGCSAYGVACGVDFGGGTDFGVCGVNVLPFVPSC